MPALIESMYSVRETPWHGLGTIVQEAPTSADALHLAGLDWHVEGKPVFTDSGIEIPGYKANTRSSDNSILGIVSDKYKVVQNDEAFAFTDALLGEGVTYETAGSLRNGKTIWLLANMPRIKILGDDIDPYLCFTNNHEGTGAVRVVMTPIRVVCNNSLNLALSNASRSWSTKHMGSMSAKLKEAEETLGLANMYMKALGEEVDKLAHKKLTNDQIKEIIEDLFPINDDDTDRVKKNMQEMRDGLYMCYLAPDIQQYLNTAYGLVNAASDFATHRQPQRNTESYKENNFNRVINGHAIIDQVYSKVCAVA